MVRKIGAPHNEELAVGALTEDGYIEIDEVKNLMNNFLCI